MHMLSPSELLLVFLIVFLLFGGKKLPELGTGLGQAIRNFSDAMKGVNADKEKKELAAEMEQKSPKQVS
ncbi:MAG: twin-arginine translocase TatA/TatE family subunit [Nitrospinae bacterium]|nr:twin-arginine translocase TatA/TatE family subunit [Nitrospinota bacterium]